MYAGHTCIVVNIFFCWYEILNRSLGLLLSATTWSTCVVVYFLFSVDLDLEPFPWVALVANDLVYVHSCIFFIFCWYEILNHSRVALVGDDLVF